MTRRRVLVIAEAANPEWVSVPLVGWSMANALRQVADIHIVTQIRNRAAFLRAGLIEGQDFTAINSERFAAPASRLAGLIGGKGKGWTFGTALASLTYGYFERLVWRRFGAAIRRGDYDVVHRLTPLSPTSSSPIARKCARAGIPFVVGPLNGGLPWPPGFDAERRREREWLSYVRGAYKLLPGRSAFLDASRLILCGSRHTAGELPRRLADRIVYLPENGIDPARFSRVADPPGDGPLRLCFIGRLVPYKGPDMAIEAALPLLLDGRATLDIVGDGPMRAALDDLVARLGCGDAVTFHGWVPHDQVQSVAGHASLFFFPSVREFGGGAVLEAMAMGLAPLVVDYGGPGELVSMAGGYAVPLGSRGAIVAALRDRLGQLAANRQDVLEVGVLARTWVHANLTWAAKAKVISSLYDWLLSPSPSKPLSRPFDRADAAHV